MANAKNGGAASWKEVPPSGLLARTSNGVTIGVTIGVTDGIGAMLNRGDAWR